MRSRKTLSEMFLGEATLEFPDGEIDALNRVLAGAARRGAIPRDALENWPILKGFAPRPKKDAEKPTAKPSVKKASPPASGDGGVAPSSRTGRVIPSTNRFRQQGPDGAQAQSKPTPAASKETGKGGSKGPGLLKRAASAIRGRDPENGLPLPKAVKRKIPGGHGPATSLPRLGNFFPGHQGQDAPEDPLSAYPNKEPVPSSDFDAEERTDPEYVSPFAHLGLSGDDSDERDQDPKLATVKKAFSAVRPHAGPEKKPGPKFPEADAWSKFGGQGDDAPEPKKKKKQGKLSRFFKGRRDDDI